MLALCSSVCSLSEQELINVFLSNIKLSAPGQQDGKKKTKNKPKGAGKADG